MECLWWYNTLNLVIHFSVIWRSNSISSETKRWDWEITRGYELVRMAAHIAAISAAKIDENWKYIAICYSHNFTLSCVFGEILSYYCVTVSGWYNTKKCTKAPFLYRVLTKFCVNQINSTVYWRMKDKLKKKKVLSFAEGTLLHWCEEAVRTWDEHATSAAVSSPIQHRMSMLSLL